MKRIIIVFIIVFCLLSLVAVVSCADEKPGVGELWIAMSPFMQVTYLEGFQDGIAECLIAMKPMIISSDSYPIVAVELSDLYKFLEERGIAVLKVVGDLYKDPANTYISFPSMIKIAYQKLKGEDIESLLREAREKALPFEN